MVVEQFKKLWLPRGVDFMIVPELSTDHCRWMSSDVNRRDGVDELLIRKKKKKVMVEKS